ncbi:hypothetical protein WH91_11240 [Devosia psychrophila]|uniref:Uncharacterized protein n=1 Tax=Devosia psychrophila TaxID=728005 RepID=A0A0F5PWH6_9HYPH|nr:hypothetical protein WH91_11240 [Devosia psychrophila]SFD05425.1 hypothetical protein SAMN04488059_1198 [Devosia psychrophila]
MACYQPQVIQTQVDENRKRKVYPERNEEALLAQSDRAELARLREADRLRRRKAADRLRRRKAADKRAAARARNREDGEAIPPPQPQDFDLLRSVVRYAQERMHEATWLQDDMRAAEMSPMTLDVVEVPRIREMVRRYAEALSNAWRFSSEHPIRFEDVLACVECGAPRLEVKMDISERPYGLRD